MQEFSYTVYEEGVPHIRPQSAQSGNDHFLVYIHHDGKISLELVGGGGGWVGGGCTPTLFHYIYHHVQSCGVNSS